MRQLPHLPHCGYGPDGPEPCIGIVQVLPHGTGKLYCQLRVKKKLNFGSKNLTAAMVPQSGKGHQK